MKLQQHAVLLRFLLAGAINTVWGWSVYSASILLGARPWLALAIGMLAGIAFNFVSLGAFVFRDMVLARLPRFLLAYGFLYTANFVCLQALQPWVEGPILGQLILTPPMAVVSYFVLSRFVFIQK